MNKNRKYILIAIIASLLLTVSMGFSVWIILSEQASSEHGYFIPKQDLTTVAVEDASTNGIYAGEAPVLAVTYQYAYNGHAWDIPYEITCNTLVSEYTTQPSGYTSTGTATVSVTIKPTGWASLLFSATTVESVELSILPVAQVGTGDYYPTVDGALTAANGADDGGVVYSLVLAEDHSIDTGRAKEAKTIYTTEQIDSNVTLCLPYNNGQRMKDTDRYGKGKNGSAGNETYTSTEITEGNNDARPPHIQCVNQVILATQMTLYGTIEICGVEGAPAPSSGNFPQAATSGWHGVLLMRNGSKLTMNTASGASAPTLKTMGYIANETTYATSAASNEAKPQIEAITGTINMPLVIYDYNGGGFTIGAYKTGGICPMMTLDTPNIQSTLICHNAASVICWASLTTGGASAMGITIPDQFNPAMVNLLGPSSGDYLMKMSGSGTVTLDYNPDNLTKYAYLYDDYVPSRATPVDINMDCDVETGKLELTIKVAIVTETVNLTDVSFPISQKITLNLDGDHTYTFNSKFKFLPGSVLNIGEDAEVVSVSGTELLFYGAVSESRASSYTTFKYWLNTEESKAALAIPAQCNVYGRLTVKGGIGGVVNTLGSSAVADFSSATAMSASEVEGNGGASGANALTGGTFTQTAVETQVARGDQVSGVQPNMSAEEKNFAQGEQYFSVCYSSPYYAWYLPNFDVTLDTQGGTLSSTVENPYPVTITVPGQSMAISYFNTNAKPTRDYYTFNHWCTSSTCTNGNECSSLTASLYDDTTLYAIWTPNTYTVNYVYVLPDGTLVDDCGVDSVGNVTATTTITLPTVESITNPGGEQPYTCTGFYTAVSGGTKLDTSFGISAYPDLADKTTGVATVYVQWMAETYTVNFVPGTKYYNDISIDPNTRAPANYNPLNDTAVHSAITKHDKNSTEEQYYFVGWYTDVDLENQYDPAVGLTEDTTLYAKWGTKATVTFTETYNGTSQGTNTTYVKPGASITAPATVNNNVVGWDADLTKATTTQATKWEFSGWSCSGQDTLAAGGSFTVPTGDGVTYAFAGTSTSTVYYRVTIVATGYDSGYISSVTIQGTICDEKGNAVTTVQTVSQTGNGSTTKVYYVTGELTVSATADAKGGLLNTTIGKCEISSGDEPLITDQGSIWDRDASISDYAFTVSNYVTITANSNS